MISNTQKIIRVILIVCTKPVRGLILAVWCMLYMSLPAFTNENNTMVIAMMA